MEKNKENRLNILFEKMVSAEVNLKERTELDQLYQEYIKDDRQHLRKKLLDDSLKKVAMN